MHWHAPDDLTLQQYLDGRLPAAEHRAFDEHLRSCGDCQMELEAARRLERLCANWREVQAPPEIAARVRQQIHASKLPYGWLLAVAASLFLGFAISRGFWRRPQPAPELGFYTPPAPAQPAPPQVGERPPTLPLAAQPVFSTGQDPSVVAFSGQVLSLAPHTQLQVVSHQGNHYLLRLNQGQVRVQEHGQVIAVETQHLRVDPLGTDFQVSRLSGHSRVELYSGSVQVSASGGERVVLTPGQTVQFPRAPRPVAKVPVPQESPVASLPGPAYPQRQPSPHPKPAWNQPVPFEPQTQSQSWRPLPEGEHRRPGGPPMRGWERSRQGQGRSQQNPGGTFSEPWDRLPPFGDTPIR